MKLSFNWALIAIAALALTSCDPDDGPGPAPAPTTGEIQASRTLFPVTGANSTIDWTLAGASIVLELGTLTLTASNATTGESFSMSGPFNPLTNVMQNITNNPELGEAIYIRNSASMPWRSTVANSSNPLFVLQVSSRDTVAKTMTGIFNTQCVNPNDTDQKALFATGTFTNLPYIVDDGTPNGTTILSWSAAGSATSAAAALAQGGGGTITISGTSSASNGVSLDMPDDVTPGTYEIGSSGNYGAFYFATSTFYFAESGTLTISAHNTVDDRIQGTFSFSAETSANPPLLVEVTAGSFDAYY